ncbi:5-formyltetrahydrofolate cyclo-ligase [Egicoccus halophilus]|uniref:5-formyltetrahydrofolate cyclo-ligase n=1 Tax=Egicoccus halophilus TaxID=1670830 RepID=A0A8J3A5J2_9ACTN|nr:5-formyltetrahydrofolate cyclo-ligase [Egicoccus halophilus]GGI03639.1 hypothetical protein GCM10011354_05040 [Egicoccus halophilus]
MEGTPKAALRSCARAARAALSGPERAAANARLVGRLTRLPELRRASGVLLYAASEFEADPAGLLPRLLAREVRTYFPRVDGEVLEVVAAADLRTLQLGYRGIREPAGAAAELTDIDVALVPGVAFDPLGGRLGQGGGHYDRLLASLPRTTTRVGIAFACQLVPRVPTEHHDATVDLVVTDRAVHRALHRTPDR